MDHRRSCLILLTLFNIFITSTCSHYVYETNFKNNNVSVVRYCEKYGKTIGVCVNVQDCPSIRVFNSSDITQRLTQYFCGYNQDKYSEVCCPLVPIKDRFFDGDEAEFERHPNIKLIPTGRCGPPPNSKHYRGGDAELTDYPWTALLKFDNRQLPYFCGGSLINNRYILTSAQCIKNKHKLIGVRLGEFDLLTQSDCVSIVNTEYCTDPPQDFIVSSEDAIIHPDYNKNTHQNDIALIRLRSVVKFSIFIAPVCLPILQTVPLFDTGLYTVVGWGVGDNGASSKTLKYADVFEKNDTNCNNYLKANKLEPSRGQTCTGDLESSRENSCIGDKGGALINSVEDDVIDVQYGIISIKSDCVNTSTVIYTKVRPYIGWILDNIKA